MRDLLRLSRGQLDLFESIQSRLVKELVGDPELAERVERLRSIDGLGPILALTWVLEIGEVKRFASIPAGAELLRPDQCTA